MATALRRTRTGLQNGLEDHLQVACQMPGRVRNSKKALTGRKHLDWEAAFGQA